MGDTNQLSLVQRHAADFKPPYLEVGAKDYGSTQDLRSLFGSEDYLGTDLAEGPGVDLTLDLTAPFEEIDARLEGRRFNTIFCLSVLEHVRQPFVVADNLSRLLRPEGRILISVPFAWEYHGYPDDYWRFSHQGVRVLFPRLIFDHPGDCLSTSKPGDFRPLDDDLGKVRVTGHWFRRQGQYWAAFGADLLRVTGRLNPFHWLRGHAFILPMSNINMIGRPRD